MTTPIHDVTTGWTYIPSMPVGTRNYTNPAYPGWQIRKSGSRPSYTVYLRGEQVGDLLFDLRDAVAAVITATRGRVAYGVDPVGNGLYQIVKFTADTAATEPLGDPMPDASRAEIEATSYNTHSLRITPEEAAEIIGSACDAAGRPAPGTVDPNRTISDEEFKSLVAIEAVEYLTRLSIQILTQNTTSPEKTARAITRVTRLLGQMADITTTRTVTAVKQLDVSDRIAKAARGRVDAALLAISPPLTFPGLPDGWEMLKQTRHWQQAFETPAGYAVISAIPTGMYEIEFRGNALDKTELSPGDAMLKLAQLVHDHQARKAQA